MDGKPRVILIDLSSLFWAAWHVNSENGMQAARSITLASVKRCIQPGDLVAVTCDSPGENFRKKLSPTYKANRARQPEAAYEELKRTEERLISDGFLLWKCPGFESDDIIATACDMAVREDHDVRVCSADKDMFQLLGPRVDMLRTNTFEVWNVARFEEKFRVKPSQFRDWLALVGDKSDNVSGCPGIGDVRATDLIAKYGSIGKLYAALDRGDTVATPANQKALGEHRKAVELSLQLVTLNYEAPIDFAQLYQERKIEPLSDDTALPHERAAVEAIANADKILSETSETQLATYEAPGDSVAALTLREVVMQKKMIAECMRAVMKRDIHFGIVPGTPKDGKPSLFKAGADTLGVMFRLRAEYETDKAVNESNYIYYRIVCKLTHIPTGKLVATGMGSCNSRESKYKRFALRKCPKCAAEAIIKGNPDYERDPKFKGGWLCHDKKGGCTAKFVENDTAITGQTPSAADPSDLDNTILKMAMKRARVDATLTGTAAGDFFTQDIEDLEGILA